MIIILLKTLLLLVGGLFILIIGTNIISFIWLLIHRGKPRIPRDDITNFFLFEGITELEKRLLRRQS
jgi:hypothetical protein